MEEFGITNRMSKLVSGLDSPDAQVSEDKIRLNQAENHLIRSELVKICKVAVAEKLTEEDFCYPLTITGDPALLEALASFFNNYFSPSFPVTPDQIAVQPGSGAALDALFCSICDDGDSILIPGPFWSGYGLYGNLHAKINIITAESPSFREALSADCISRLVTAYEAAPDKSRIKALVVSNPSTPAGGCYSPEVIRGLMSFCHERGLHYISDEVYAHCTINNPDSPEPHTSFSSALSLSNKPAPGKTEVIRKSHVHTVWSISKGFGSPGMRIGCIISQANKPLLASTSLLSIWQSSILSSIYVTALLTSPKLPELMALNSERLFTSYQMITKAFQEWNIEYIPVSAGLCIFAKVIKNATTWEEVTAVVEEIEENGVLVMIAGQERGGIDGDKGWIAMTFSVSEDVMKEVIFRLGKVLKQI